MDLRQSVFLREVHRRGACTGGESDPDLGGLRVHCVCQGISAQFSLTRPTGSPPLLRNQRAPTRDTCWVGWCGSPFLLLWQLRPFDRVLLAEHSQRQQEVVLGFKHLGFGDRHRNLPITVHVHAIGISIINISVFTVAGYEARRVKCDV